MSSHDATTPPIAERRPVERMHHGDTFVDPYEWLRSKQDPAVIDYLGAENTFTERRTAHLRELSDAIFGEIKARTQETDLSVPTYRTHSAGPDGDGRVYWYYVRTIEGQE